MPEPSGLGDIPDAHDSTDPGEAPDAHGSIDEALRNHIYHIALTVGIGLLATGTAVYHYFEDWSWVDSFYFSAIALTTVGFGDLAPTSDGTKLFTVFFVFFGMALIGLILKESLRRQGRRVAQRRHTSSADAPGTSAG